MYLLLLRSESHYDSRNHQRKIEYPKETQIENFNVENDNLIIEWKDQHHSKYSLSELELAFSQKTMDFTFTHGKLSEVLPPKLWDAQNCPIEETKIDFNAYINTEDGFREGGHP